MSTSYPLHSIPWTPFITYFCSALSETNFCPRAIYINNRLIRSKYCISHILPDVSVTCGEGDDLEGHKPNTLRLRRPDIRGYMLRVSDTD